MRSRSLTSLVVLSALVAAMVTGGGEPAAPPARPEVVTQAPDAASAMAAARRQGRRVAVVATEPTRGPCSRTRIACALGDVPTALEHHRRARDIAEGLGLRYLMAEALLGIAGTHVRAGARVEAVAAVRRTVAHTRPAGYRVLTEQALALAEALSG